MRNNNMLESLNTRTMTMPMKVFSSFSFVLGGITRCLAHVGFLENLKALQAQQIHCFKRCAQTQYCIFKPLIHSFRYLQCIIIICSCL